MTFDRNTRQFTIETGTQSNGADSPGQLYSVKIVGTLQTSPTQVKDLAFKVYVVATCGINTLSSDTPIADTTYYLGNGALDLSAIFATSEANCPITYELTQDGYGSGLFNTELITFTDDGFSDHTITFDSGDAAYDGDVVTLTFTVTLTNNPTETLTFEFDVTLTDLCHTATLSFDAISTPIYGNLWSRSSVYLGYQINDDLDRDCGATTFIFRLSNGIPATGQVFALTDANGYWEVAGTPVDPVEDIGTYTYYVTAHQGTFTTTTASSNLFSFII